MSILDKVREAGGEFFPACKTLRKNGIYNIKVLSIAEVEPVSEFHKKHDTVMQIKFKVEKTTDTNLDIEKEYQLQKTFTSNFSNALKKLALRDEINIDQDEFHLVLINHEDAYTKRRELRIKLE